jgi:tetratricopeptide (TPR) repeat protein
MIVRDAAQLLPPCLASVRGIVDEIVIADTGSQDATISVAQCFGARVISIPWKDDFAQARNAALREVHTGWVLSLDADEQLDENARRHIPRLLQNGRVGGYQVTIRNYMRSLADRLWDRPAKHNDSALPAARQYPAYVEHQNVRLFRRAPETYFVGRVHESVGPAIEKTGKRLGQANFLIHHFGLASDHDSQARKNQFYRQLGRQKIRDLPENAQAHFELGLLEMDNFHNLLGAQELFEQARTLDSRFGLAWLFEGLTLEKQGQHLAALRCLLQAEHSGYRTALLFETRGDAYYNVGDFVSACESYAAARRRDARNLSLRSKFGLSVLRSGDRAGGLAEIRTAIAAAPQTPDLHDRLILALVSIGDLPAAATSAATKLRVTESPTPRDFLRAASLYGKAGDWPCAGRIAAEGLRTHPQDASLLQASAEIATAEAGLHTLSALK